MSKFTKEEQTEIVRIAMQLEVAIQIEEAEMARLNREGFRPAPKAPKRKIIDMNIQPVSPDYSGLPSANMTFAQFLEYDLHNNPNIYNIIFGLP